MKGWGYAPGGPPGNPCSVIMNDSYHKEHEYIWFRSGDQTFLRYKAFYEVKGVGHAHRRIQRGPKICVTECLLSLGTRIYIV